MRRRKNAKKSDSEGGGSDVADEPEEFQDSGEDWTPAEKQAAKVAPGSGKKRAAKATANNAKKKQRKASTTEESEGEEEDEDVEDEEDSDDENKSNKSDESALKDVPKYFHSGNYVLLKSDVKWSGDSVATKLSDINLWKIDGKALLQKYIPLEYNGKTLHKCTCVYSGWNVANRENYYPITEILDKNPKTDAKEQCVALDLDDLIKVKDKV